MITNILFTDRKVLCIANISEAEDMLSLELGMWQTGLSQISSVEGIFYTCKVLQRVKSGFHTSQLPSSCGADYFANRKISKQSLAPKKPVLAGFYSMSIQRYEYLKTTMSWPDAFSFTACLETTRNVPRFALERRIQGQYWNEPVETCKTFSQIQKTVSYCKKQNFWVAETSH